MKSQPETRGAQHARVLCLAWDPKSTVVAIISESSVRLLWADSKKPQETIGGLLPANLCTGCWSPDGSSVAVGTFDSVITVFKVFKPSVQSRLQLGTVGDVTALAFSLNGLYLVAGTALGWIVTVRVDGLTPIRKLQRGKAITSIVWSDASVFVVASIGEDLAVFDVGDGALILTCKPRSVYGLGRPRPDGVVPVSNGRDVFSVNLTKVESTRSIEVGSIVAMDSDAGGTVVLQERSGLVQVYRGNRLYLTIQGQRRSDDGWMGGLSISPDGRRMAYINHQGEVAMRRVGLMLPAFISGLPPFLLRRLLGAGRVVASVKKRLFWWSSDGAGIQDVEGELREAYSGLMGTKVIWTAVFSFLPIVVAHVWTSVKVTVSLGTALCLVYHGVGAYVWFHYRHLSGVDFRQESKERLLRKLIRYHFVLGILSYPVVAVVALIWASQIAITFFGLHHVSFPVYIAEFLGIGP